ncbi:hypothetical protein BKN38_04005 [Helicobacter sp. CLO-3]|nr:hypothetical protein BA723_04905 [Helicobacter sp. CLO-3]OHU84106.1 hypothetical protein BKN38_04005 [Helicobacter sp. CLO-3]
MESSDLPTPREEIDPLDLIWYDKEYAEDESGKMRWEFELWNFGYTNAFEYCKDIWLAFGYNIVLIDFMDCVDTMVWRFKINGMTCIWFYDDFPPRHYILPYKETEENLNKLEEYIKVILNELNRLVIEKRIEPY